jgi:hypothetical protein
LCYMGSSFRWYHIYASCIGAWIISTCYQLYLIGWNESLSNIFPAWPQTMILPFAAPLVAGILGKSHCVWPQNYYLHKR